MPSDLRIIYLVRLQRIMNNISKNMSCDERGVLPALTGPLRLYTKSLQTELRGLLVALPIELQHDRTYGPVQVPG